MIAPAFMNSDVIKMMSVPANSMLTFEAKKVLFTIFSLNILKISKICVLVSLLN